MKESGLKGSVEVKELDLADLSSVRSLAAQLQSEPSIDILICNAGVAGLPLTYTKDNFETQIGTNHVGHFLLCDLLLEKLKRQTSPVRIVVVSSDVHASASFNVDDLNYRHSPYKMMRAYPNSKLCNILFVKELARRTQGTNIQAFSLHPGVILTGLSRHLALLRLFITVGLYFKRKTPEQGAATSVYAATAAELAGHSGAYLADCGIKEPSAQARDAELAKKLWAVTEMQLQDPSTR